MTYNRAVHMYGDKLCFYPISLYVLFFGIGWLFARYEVMGFGYVFARAVALYLSVYFVDAIIKSAVFAKDHFKLSLTLKS